jgi:predicted ABC-type sugar transport system permease subunit
MIFETKLIVYTGSGTPPYFMNSGKSSEIRPSIEVILTVHMYTDCRTIATLRADLTGIPASDFAMVNSGNGDWYKVTYNIEMSFEATLSFRLVFKGTFFSGPDCCN